MSVKCDVCEDYYKALFPDNKYHQGLDCDGEVIKNKTYMGCCYGSCFDSQWFKIIDQSKFTNVRYVCDHCIKKILIDGIIIKADEKDFQHL